MSIDRMKVMRDKLLSCAEQQNLDEVDTEEMSDVIDMIKDLSSAIYYGTIVDGMEKGTQENEIMEKAMLKANLMTNNKENNNDVRPQNYYYPLYYPLMTREGQWNKGRMFHGSYPEYYDFPYEYPVKYANGGNNGGSGGNRGGSAGGGNSNSGSGSSQNSGGNNARGGGTRGYSEGSYIRDEREGRSGQSRRMYVESKEMNQTSEAQLMKLKEYMNDLTEDMTEIARQMTPEQKQMFQQNISKISNLIGQMK